MEEPQQELLAWLGRPESWGGRPVRRVDTHISSVFLVGDEVYKLKRAVTLPFLDFHDLARREAACRRELDINRRSAPGIYLDVVAIRRDGHGGFTLDGDGQVVDWLVVMRRFEDDFGHIADTGRLTDEHALAIADAVAALHRKAPPTPGWGGEKGIRFTVDTNERTLRQFSPDPFGRETIDALGRASRAWLVRLTPLLEARRAGGFVRRCHGDLHLGNICLFEGHPTLFDAIEFNEDFASIDVFYDVAFLIMDLLARKFDGPANLVFNRYLETTGDFGALPALPLFLSLRAAIRAHVQALMAKNSGSSGCRQASLDYLGRAQGFLEPSPPRLVAVGGLSGSGKSTLARPLAAVIPPPPGAVWLRSDVIRKQLAGVPPDVRLDPSAYGPDMTKKTYDRLFHLAEQALVSGYSVVADAVFARPHQRDAIRDVARRAGRPFEGIWLESDPDQLRRRVAARRGDVSDATVAVVDLQLGLDLGPLDWHRLDSRDGPDRSLASAAGLLGL